VIDWLRLCMNNKLANFVNSPDAEAIEEKLASDAEAEPTLQASDALTLKGLRYAVQPPAVLPCCAALG